MRKLKVYLFCLLVLFCLCSCHKKGEPYKKSENITPIWYTARKIVGKTILREGTEYHSTMYQFDNKDRVVLEIHNSSTRNIGSLSFSSPYTVKYTYKSTYEYNSITTPQDGNIYTTITRIDENLVSSEVIHDTYTTKNNTTYDNYGRCVENRQWNNNKIILYNIYNWNDTGYIYKTYDSEDKSNLINDGIHKITNSSLQTVSKYKMTTYIPLRSEQIGETSATFRESETNAIKASSHSYEYTIDKSQLYIFKEYVDVSWENDSVCYERRTQVSETQSNNTTTRYITQENIDTIFYHIIKEPYIKFPNYKQYAGYHKIYINGHH